MTEKFNVDDDSVRGLAKLLEETGLTEIEYQVGTHRIRVVRSNMSVVSQAVSAPSRPASVKETSPVETPIVQGETVKSPMVGTVYLSAEPGAAAFIKTGDLVKKGDTLLIIEAMKVMNPIRAPRDGKVLSICIENAKPVEFDEPLLILE